MAILRELDERIFNQWVKCRPLSVQKLIKKRPPNLLYRMRCSRHRVEIVEYCEDDTVIVSITGKYNCIAYDRNLDGIKAADLVECDLPGPNEELGTLLDDKDDIASLMEIIKHSGTTFH